MTESPDRLPAGEAGQTTDPAGGLSPDAIAPDAITLKAWLEDRGFMTGAARTVPELLAVFDPQLAALCLLIEEASSLGYRRGTQPGPLLPPKRQVAPVL